MSVYGRRRTIKSRSATTPPSTGLALWFRADAGVVQLGGLVSSWTDQSANAVTVSQATGANQPAFKVGAINGLPALTFDLTKVLSTTATSVLTSGSDRSVIVVAKAANAGTGTNTGGAFLCFRSSPTAWIAQLSNQPGDGHTYVYGNSNIAPPYLASQYSFTASPFLYEHYGSVGAYPTIYVDRAAKSLTLISQIISDTGTAGLYVGNYFGATIGFIGDIAELIAYDHILSAGDQASVRAYCAARYGV